MTTQRTPWDADLEAITYSSNGPTLVQTEQLRDLHNLRDGYLKKAEDDAPLLEAAKVALSALATLDDPTWGRAVKLQLQAAIAQCEKEGYSNEIS